MATSSGALKDELPMGIVMKESNSYFCEYCTCILGGFSCMQQHVAGKRHKKEMQRCGIEIPPKKEIAQVNIIPEDTSISNKPVYASYNSNGIVECAEKWNTFQCVYCNCILNAGDVNLHIGGKRHTKRANQAALENFISKRNEKNEPKPVEIVAARTAMPAWQQIPECSMEELDELVKKKNLANRKEAEKDSFPEPTLLVTANDLPSDHAQIKLDADENLEKASKLSADEKTSHAKENVEENGNSSRLSTVPAMHSTPETKCLVKNVSETTTSVMAAQQANASVIAVPQAIVSGKSILQSDISVGSVAQSNASAKDISQANISPRATTETITSVKTIFDTNSSAKTSFQTDTSVKTSPQKNISLMTSEAKPLMKATLQCDTSVKAVSLKDDSVKTALQQNSSVKASLQTNASEKCTPQSNISVKSSSQTSGFTKAAPQTSASIKGFQQRTALVKADPQMCASLRVFQRVSSSLNEYLTMVSNPVVGLNYVVETMASNEPSKFQCNLCKVNSDDQVMKEHINSTMHYLEYLRTVDPINAAEVKALKENERNQKILELVTELERKKGRGTILVKTAETEKDKSNKDDFLETGNTIRNQCASYTSDDAETIGSAINIVAQEFLSKDVIRNAQKRDPKTSKIIKELMDGVQNSSHIMHDDILYEKRNGKYRVVVAKTMKQAIYESYHFSLCRKTPGAVTYINDSYSWSGINEDITKFAKQCYVCQIRKLRQLSGGEAIPILVRRGQAKRKPSPTKRAFNDLTNAEIEDTQRRDADTMKIISDMENGLETQQHVTYENILYILDENGQYKIVVSSQMKKLLFEKNHSVLCWKSTERPPVINAITQVYFWQRMLEEVKLFAAKCKKCRTNIPVKRISEQVSTASSGKSTEKKKSTEKIKDAVTKDAPKEKTQDAVAKDVSKERSRDEPKEKLSRDISWDKTKSLKPPIVEQNILTDVMIRDAQTKDSNTSKIIKLLMDGVPSSSYILYEGILYQEKNGKYLTMVADKMKQTIYEKCHSTLCSRYTGRSSQRDGTKYINRHFSWPAMSQDVYIFVKNCHVCQIRTLRTKAFSRSSEERHNNKLVIAASRSGFNDLTDNEITAAQRKDPDTIKLLKRIEDGMHISRHILYEDILYCQGGHGDYKVVITPEMKATIYQNNHFLLCWESTVWPVTVDMIAQVYLWPRIHEDIRDFMESCQICKREFPEQQYIDQLAYTAAVPEGDKPVSGLMEQYHQTYSDPAYYATQQYQSNYPIQPIDPYAAANSATYPYGTYPQYWNTSDSMVTYPTPSSGKRPADDDFDSTIKEHSTDSYSERKRCRSDLSTEYDYSRSQNDRRRSTSFKAQEPLDQAMPLAVSQVQHPPISSAHSEFNKSNEPENSNNTFGFTITNAEDAEVTLDIINSLMHIYLKYQLKKLHGPVQKLLQESLKEEEANESVDSNTNNAANSDTNELFVRLPRLHKGERTEVKRRDPYPANSNSGRISISNFCQPSYGQHLYNKSTYTTTPCPSVLKSDKSFNPPFPSRNKTMDTLPSKESDLPKTSSCIPKSLHTDDDKKILNDDIDGFPMKNEIPDPTDKIPCNWEDDIDGKPLITESPSKIAKKHTVGDNVRNSPKKTEASVDNLKSSSIRCMTSSSLSKSLQNKDDDIDGIPLGSRTSKSFDKYQVDCSANKQSSSLNKPEDDGNDVKDGPFLKPNSTSIFKKPPDDWDKNANKTSQTVKGGSSTKSQGNWSESSDDAISDTKTVSDKYPNWKKGGMQGGTSFYNSPLYNKANEGGASTTSTGSNAPVIDLFKRYRRVQL